jgi:uncharacterized protein (TIGR00295 family)
LTGGKAKERRLPSRDECILILQESGCDEQVIKHSLAVNELAVKIAKRCRADVDLVEVGSLLHDLGRCRSHKIDHAVKGAEMADEKKLPSSVVKIIERHIGGGIDKSEAKSLGLPVKDYTPQTLEEKIVSHADNLIAGTRRTNVKEAVGWLVRQGMQDPALKVLKLHEELSAVCGMNLDDI